MNFNYLFMCFVLNVSIALAHSAGSLSDSEECPEFFVPSHLDSQQFSDIFEYTSDIMRYPPDAETLIQSDSSDSTEDEENQEAQSQFENIYDFETLVAASWFNRSPVSWYRIFTETTDPLNRDDLILQNQDALEFFVTFCDECARYMNQTQPRLDETGFYDRLLRSQHYGIGLYYLVGTDILTIVYIAIDGTMHVHHCTKNHDDT